jgi:hypothetical protein
VRRLAPLLDVRPTHDGLALDLPPVWAPIPADLWALVASLGVLFGVPGLSAAWRLSAQPFEIASVAWPGFVAVAGMFCAFLGVGAAQPRRVQLEIGRHRLVIRSERPWGRIREDAVGLHDITGIERTRRGLALVRAGGAPIAVPLGGRSRATVDELRALLLEHVARASKARGAPPAEIDALTRAARADRAHPAESSR